MEWGNIVIGILALGSVIVIVKVVLPYFGIL